MIDVSGGVTNPVATVPAVPREPTTDQTSIQKVSASTTPTDSTTTSTAATSGKAQHAAAPVYGFNPSEKIDPETHIVVMTVRGTDGSVLRQIPNEHELAAYKTELAQNKK